MYYLAKIKVFQFYDWNIKMKVSYGTVYRREVRRKTFEKNLWETDVRREEIKRELLDEPSNEKHKINRQTFVWFITLSHV